MSLASPRPPRSSCQSGTFPASRETPKKAHYIHACGRGVCCTVRRAGGRPAAGLTTSTSATLDRHSYSSKAAIWIKLHAWGRVTPPAPQSLAHTSYVVVLRTFSTETIMAVYGARPRRLIPIDDDDASKLRSPRDGRGRSPRVAAAQALSLSVFFFKFPACVYVHVPADCHDFLKYRHLYYIENHIQGYHTLKIVD
jgi:hypothetical protein